MKRIDAKGLDCFCVPAWEKRSRVVHGFFTRAGGVSPPPYASLNAGPKGDDAPENVRENLQRTAQALSIPADRIFCAEQVHGDQILEVTGCRQSIFRAAEPLQGDGFLTAKTNLYLGILTADCVPLLLHDPRRCVVGAVHAGWRGTAKRIASKAVRQMHHAFGCESTDLLVAFGPSVGPCCYVVGEEVARAFLEEDRETARFLHPEGSGRWTMNLAGINRHQLVKSGIQARNISVFPLCTSCRKDLFFSVRGEGEPTGRQIAVIGIRPKSRRTKERIKILGEPYEKTGRGNQRA